MSYLFEEYQGSHHARRVATWIGFLLKAIERTSTDIQLSRSRQIVFEYRGSKFKARYNHHAGSRGGINILEVLHGPGSPDGEMVVQVTSLNEAEKVYDTLNEILDRFIES